LLSTKNSLFWGWADPINQDISSGTGEYKSYTPQMIIDAVNRQYLDMVVNGTSDQLDPQQAHMMVLSAQLMDTKAQLQVAMASKVPTR